LLTVTEISKRYDVRNLLDDLQSLKFNGHGVTNHSQEDHENLDVERYADLDSDEGELFLMSDEDERDQFVGKCMNKSSV
jgi:hypothetical protein